MKEGLASSPSDLVIVMRPTGPSFWTVLSPFLSTYYPFDSMSSGVYCAQGIDFEICTHSSGRFLLLQWHISPAVMPCSLNIVVILASVDH